MNERVRKLIPAIVSYINEHDSYVSKTKLLKLLYLLDVEWYRENRETYTGFDWVFLHLGPWATEYDPLLQSLTANFEIISKKSEGDFEAELFTTPEPIDFTRLFESYSQEKHLRTVLSEWGIRSTPEILDYVYFWTEPMEKSARYEPLDFSSIPREQVPAYRRIVSKSTPKEIEAARARIAEAAKRLPESETKTSPQSRYDAEYLEAMANLDCLP